ncbi:TetR/AcrR family transcriptional regulator [Gordonia sp. PKS22-38]|uniref:TetR/AcrR family transcriptional regulator n=1 Tax=Gordonia prachuapensis TaxID=3115651 RepID=A0ABU7MXP2_9ACTN|nr:TetR/AcrR family transcriptional regulator [Gordonia sp. PKS22-38]
MTDSERLSDKRLIKGARARATIARHAADVASVEGLTGLSLGKLATDLGLSKSGVSTLFGCKENLQLAAVESARDVFLGTVVAPALNEERGLARLRTLVDRWLDYVATPAMPGGCFRAATVPEFDSRPGPVRDAIGADRREWLDFLEKAIRYAQDDGALADHDAATLAFELDAVVAAANSGARIGDESALPTARRIVERLLGEADQHRS